MVRSLAVIVLAAAAGWLAFPSQCRAQAANADTGADRRFERVCLYFTDQRALDTCTALIDKTPDDRKRADYHYRRGWIYYFKQECDLSIADLTEAIRLDPSHQKSIQLRGSQWRSCKDDNDRAIADFSSVIRLAPTSENYWLRGDTYRRKGDFARALADFNEAIRINPKDAQSYDSRGILYRDRGDYRSAFADLDQAIQLEPTSMHYASRGSIWRASGDLVRALADQDMAVSLGTQTKEAFAFTSRGDTLRYMGEYARAQADYDKALEFAPNFIAAWTGKGLTFEKMGDIAKARAAFEKAATLQWVGDFDGARNTARARLASFDSGQAPPSIPAAPTKAASLTSIPTPAIAAPILTTPLPAEQVQAMAASQGRRIALVIGNANYMNKSTPSLLNPRNDAEAVATLFRNIGFQSITLLVNASRARLIDALRTMAREAQTADWAVIYYAGHGVEVNGVNYMIPVDANVGPGRDMRLEGVALDEVMTSIDAARKIKLVFLDACRDNPFAVTVSATAKSGQTAPAGAVDGGAVTRSVGRGLGAVKAPGASLIVYAAKHGQTALDGEGENSPFAVAVVQRLATPGVEINKVIRLVRDDVMEATAGRQEPFTYGSLPGKEDFFFVTGK